MGQMPQLIAHISCHTESGRFSFRGIAEPAPLLLFVLLGPQWLGVLRSTLISALAEVLPLQCSFASAHFRLGVSCIVPGISGGYTARNTMQAPMSVALKGAAAYSSTVFFAASACPSRTLVRLSVCVRYLVVFRGFLLFGTAP